jgi:hypothetical protein
VSVGEPLMLVVVSFLSLLSAFLVGVQMIDPCCVMRWRRRKRRTFAAWLSLVL